MAGTAVYLHLSSNIRTAGLVRGGATSGAGDLTRPQPVNLLVLGSDTRSSSEDCKLGGACASASATAAHGSEATGNADVEMLVHLSADRSHAQIVSIPRDTVVDIPGCTDPSTGREQPARRERINSSFNAGPDCTVAAVHQLTGLPISHFAVIDFAGVVRMSKAVGGVDVCVDDDVYDNYSRLKLAEGTHSLEGESALQFLRTRHAFGDGSDLGRAGAQHLFLSAMLRKMTSASTLVNPVTAYRLADAATKALTVDKELGSLDQLVQAAYQFGKVPNDGTEFITMPTIANPDNPNEVLAAPGDADRLWAALADDRRLTEPSPTAARSAAPSTSGEASAPATSGPASPTPSASTTPTRASDATGCAHVSTGASVLVGGRVMSPAQAFDATPEIPVSAP